MFILTILYISILGFIVGSFLNVLIDRLPQGENPFKGRSHCDYCKKKLSFFDLIPIVSFLFLGGRCRICRKKLSWQYPIIELLTGFIFLFLFSFVFDIQPAGFLESQIFHFQLFSNTLFQYIFLLIIFSSFLVLFIADAKYQILPDEMIISSIFGAIAYIVATNQSLLMHFLAASFGFLLFFMIYIGAKKFLKKEGMGFGDVKFAFVLGLFLGFYNLIIALYVAFLTGAIVSTILILGQKKRLGQQIAFGPFLILGGITAFFYGSHISSWYMRFLGI